MVRKELLSILRCPENHSVLKIASTKLLEQVNRAISAGTLKNHGGEVVTQPLEEGLIREDGTRLYPVLDDIPVLLIDEAIDLAGFDQNS